MRIFLTPTSGQENVNNVADGMNLNDFLRYSGINPSKDEIILNGCVVTDFSQILREGDRIRATSKHYNSGMAV